jgi:hypothetical protein
MVVALVSLGGCAGDDVLAGSASTPVPPPSSAASAPAASSVPVVAAGQPDGPASDPVQADGFAYWTAPPYSEVVITSTGGCESPPADYLLWARDGFVPGGPPGVPGGAGDSAIGAILTDRWGAQWAVWATESHYKAIYASPLPFTPGGVAVSLWRETGRETSTLEWVDGPGEPWEGQPPTVVKEAAKTALLCLGYSLQDDGSSPEPETAARDSSTSCQIFASCAR